MIDFPARARSLADAIRDNRTGMSESRMLPGSLSAMFREAGFYRMCIPAESGGYEAAPRTLVATLEALAEADASAAWCVMISATTGSLAAYVPQEAGREIFADETTVMAGVYAPTGRARREGDAYRVSGRWRWNSNGRNATWLCGGCMIESEGDPQDGARPPPPRMLIFPASQAEFIDTWHTGGLRGTGSGDMALSETVIPVARSVSLAADRPWATGPLYAFPVFGLLAMGIAAVASGNAQAALREFEAEASSRRQPGGRLLRERGTVQATYAEAAARLHAARAYLTSEVEACWQDAQASASISTERRAHLRLSATHMVRTAAEVVRVVQDLSGGGGVFLASSLQRRLADAQTMTAHIMVAPATYELTGRALLGAPVSTAEL